MNKKYIYIISAIAIILIALTISAIFLIPLFQKPEFKILENGMLKISKKENIKFEISDLESNEYFKISKVNYSSIGTNVFGLILEPPVIFKLPGAVLLPGSGVSKEAELNTAATIASLGFVVIILDQRGVGESQYPLEDLSQSYKLYQEGKRSSPHLMIYDALIAADILRQLPSVETENIIYIGESMGGRNAIIASYFDIGSKGVLGISTSGFGFPKGDDPEIEKYISSIDADSYVGKLFPVKLAMIHNQFDPNIPIDAALATFQRSSEPRSLLLINDTSDECKHGYCDTMHDALKTSLQFLLK
tara:strand:- start:17982 stop:18893 length:912 start_codon:yes stop_codon:yes gene_type:complete